MELCCNLDDMTPEALGFAQERLWEAGALDVYTVPIGMKKSRPGVLLACLCREEDAGKLAEAILRHTTTLGVRRMSLARTLRPRSFRTVQTPWGPVTVKETPGGGKPEYEEAAAIARREGAFRFAIGARPGRARVYLDEKGLLSGRITRDSALAMGEDLSRRVPMGDNLRAGAEYRTKICQALVRRGLLKLEEAR